MGEVLKARSWRRRRTERTENVAVEGGFAGEEGEVKGNGEGQRGRRGVNEVGEWFAVCLLVC